ncbi:antimicrobial resistance protein Mig-14 [Buttiauxella noackiae]
MAHSVYALLNALIIWCLYCKNKQMLRIDDMKSVKRWLLGWVHSDFSSYKKAYQQFGGSLNMNPDVLDYFMHKKNLSVEFFKYEQNGEIKASYFTVNGKPPGLNIACDYPVSFDELLIPAHRKARFFLPDSTNKLSVGNQHNVKNATFTLFRKKQVCWVKNAFSAKNEKNRRNEFNKFIKNGGEVKTCDELSSEELAHIYVQLFKLRFEENVRCYERANLIEFLSTFRNMLFGNVLYINGKPCAYDLMFKSESHEAIYFDVPNGGLDKNYLHLSIGSVLMWLNIQSAKALCASLGKKMTLSIGIYEPQWEYKKRWATVSKVGKVLC